MRFPAISKVLLILILPLLYFLLISNYIGFNKSFYQEKFSEYRIQNKVPDAQGIHQKVMYFLIGKNKELPNVFNEREKHHLFDVKNIVSISTIALYILIALFISLAFISGIILKTPHKIINFVGNVLVFGGLLTIFLATALFLAINSNFSSAFESFHQIFFEKNTYTFNPANEVIVNLYPEQLFMDLGIKISKAVLIISAIAILVGAFLLHKSKRIKRQAKT